MAATPANALNVSSQGTAYFDGTATFSAIANVVTGEVLISQGTSSAPIFSATPTVTSITFGSGAALNTFTQGTFSPTLVGSGSNPTPTYTIQVGHYQRVGRIVNISSRVAYSAITGGSGNMFMASLPFTSANNASESRDFAIDIGTTQATALPASQTFAFAFNTQNSTTLLLCGSLNAGTRNLWQVNTSSTFDFSCTGSIEV